MSRVTHVGAVLVLGLVGCGTPGGPQAAALSQASHVKGVQLTFAELDVPPALLTGTSAYSINNDGIIVGNYSPGVDKLGLPEIDGFLYRHKAFTDIQVAGAGLSPNPPFGANYLGELAAINNDGTSVGLYGDAKGNSMGFLYSPRGRISLLPALPYQIAGFFGINNDGVVTGFYDAVGHLNVADYHGFLLDRGVYRTIDYPGASGTQLAQINDRGQVTGVWFGKDGAPHGLRKDGHRFVSLDYPGATQTYGWGINNKGTIVGWWNDGVADHGFLWRDGDFIASFDVPGATGTEPLGLNDEGQIVGTYNGFTRGFVATVVRHNGDRDW